LIVLPMRSSVRRTAFLPAALVVAALLPSAAHGQSTSTATLTLKGPSTVTEGQSVKLTITRSGGTSAPVSATISVVSGDPADVQLPPGPLMMRTGLSRTLIVKAVDDDVLEPAKQIVLGLTDPSAGATVAPDQVTMTLHDDDAAFAVPEVTARENQGTVDLPLLRGDAGYDLHGSLRVTGGSADLFSPIRPVVLPTGNAAPHVTLSLANDAVWHKDQTRTIKLAGHHGPGAGIVVHVVDDDPHWTAPWIAPTAQMRVERTLALRRPRLRAVCNKACLLSASLRIDPGVAKRLHVSQPVASGEARLLAGARRTVALRASRHALTRLRGRRVPARLVVTTSDAQGNKRTVIKHVTVVA
jgi:hypothetical protein